MTIQCVCESSGQVLWNHVAPSVVKDPLHEEQLLLATHVTQPGPLHSMKPAHLLLLGLYHQDSKLETQG